MNHNTSTDALDELTTSLESDLTRRAVLKKIGVGGLLLASATAFPLAAEAKDNYISYANLTVTPSSSTVLVRIDVSVRLSTYAVNAIKAGYAEYKAYAKLWEEDDGYPDLDFDDNQIGSTRWWTLPAQRQVNLPPYKRTFKKSELRPYCEGIACRFYGSTRLFRYDDDNPKGKRIDSRETNRWERRL